MLKGIMFRETCCFRGYYGCGLYTAVSSVAYNSIFAFLSDTANSSNSR